jgi:hypothetical protein
MRCRYQGAVFRLHFVVTYRKRHPGREAGSQSHGSLMREIARPPQEGIPRPSSESLLMKAYRYAVVIAALTLISCSDEKAEKDLLAPETKAVVAASPEFNLMPGNGSSVCVASQKDLAAIEAELQQAPTAELQETKDALTAITADVCS